MNWVKKHKLPAIEAIQFNRKSCIKINNLQQALYLLFNSAQNHQTDSQLLEEIPCKEITKWNLFLKEEFVSAIEKCNNSSTSGLNKLSWRHLKKIIRDTAYLNKLIDIANGCINLGHQPLHFKTFTTIIIPKPNKKSYNSPKAYQPIVLLNIIGKLFEKVIDERMQFTTISNNFIHPCQLGSLKQRATSDTGVILTHFIQMGWVKNCTTSMLAFDIAQFFLSLNHHLFSSILIKASFEPKISTFFQNYLVGRKTKYLWNDFSSPFSMLTLGLDKVQLFH